MKSDSKVIVLLQLCGLCGFSDNKNMSPDMKEELHPDLVLHHGYTFILGGEKSDPYNTHSPV